MTAPCPTCPLMDQLQQYLAAGGASPLVCPTPPSREPNYLLWTLAILLTLQTLFVCGWMVLQQLREQEQADLAAGDDSLSRLTEAVHATREEAAAARRELESAIAATKKSDDFRFGELGLRLAELRRRLEATEKFAKEGSSFLQQQIEDRLCEALAKEIADRQEARQRAAAEEARRKSPGK